MASNKNSKKCNEILGSFILKMHHAGHLYFLNPIESTEGMAQKMRAQCLTINIHPYFEVGENDENMLEILRISSVKVGATSIYKSIKILIAQWLQEGGLPAAMEKIKLLPFDFLKINLPSEIGLSPDIIDKLYESYNLMELETLIGCQFRQPFWLIRALSRKTSPYFNVTGSYMHMAFFGDAVMDVLVYQYLIKKSESFKQDYTHFYLLLKSNRFFSKLGAKFRLKKFLIDDSKTLHPLQKREKYKLNADLWEAIAGAMFIELDMDMEKFYSKMVNLISESLEYEMGNFDRGIWDSKTKPTFSANNLVNSEECF